MAGKSEDSIERKWKSVIGHIFLQDYPSPTSSQAHVFSLFKFVFFQEVSLLLKLCVHFVYPN